MFNIINKRAIFLSISAVVILAGIIAMIICGGLNTDIDFTGGTAMQIDLGVPYDENGIREALRDVEGVQLSAVQDIIDVDSEALIKMNVLTDEQRTAVTEALKAKYEASQVLSVDDISATVGGELWANAAKSIIIAVILMLLYITFRFELLSGLSAILALAHDLLVMMAIYAIFRFPVNTSFIAAMLTILGYSINATIVIFDRIRENTRFLKKEAFGDIVNKSIWQSMGRAVNTSVTTLLTIVMVYILGVPSIRDFALPLIIGIVAGTYSSIFIASQFWVLFKGKNSGKVASKAKA